MRSQLPYNMVILSTSCFISYFIKKIEICEQTRATIRIIIMFGSNSDKEIKSTKMLTQCIFRTFSPAHTFLVCFVYIRYDNNRNIFISFCKIYLKNFKSEWSKADRLLLLLL